MAIKLGRLIATGCASVLLAAPGHAASRDAGMVKTMVGEVRIERGGSTVVTKIGEEVQNLDRIFTGKDSSVGVTLRDETLLSTGANSVLVIDQYEFDTESREGNTEVSLLKGTLRFVTGVIGKLRPKAVLVKTPVATIGIRGTDFIVEVPNE